MPTFYLTTPIYYVNARPHLGHTYTTVVADTIARYKRMCGYDVVLLTGTDEHGQKVERAAKAAGLRPLQYADRISADYRRLWSELDISLDRFVRTTEPRHERSVQMLFRKAQDQGYVYKGSYEGQYCVFDEMYVDEPLPGGLCPECRRPTELIREENYYFKLKAFESSLLELYHRQPGFIQPESRRNEVIAFVRAGLRDLSISRTSFSWGIPWPGDDNHIFYVWGDALTSYLTGVGYSDDEEQWEKYWPADLHLIGKEILRFHAVYWPAFLMAAGEPLPKQIFAHGWWLFQDQKMSKSRGNIQYPQPIARVLGIDALRYFLLREMVFGQDGNFSRQALLTRYNADLANGLGNLASRILAMIQQYFAGTIPQPSQSNSSAGFLRGAFRPLMSRVYSNLRTPEPGYYDQFQFSSALQTIWTMIAHVDGYLVQEKPWAIATDPSARHKLAGILYDSAEALRIIAVLAHPALPHATQQIWQQLGERGELAGYLLEQLDWGGLTPGTAIGDIRAIFPRVDIQEAAERIEQMEDEMNKPATPSPAAAPASPGQPLDSGTASLASVPQRISIEDFAKVDMRVGVIKSADRIPGADKILKVQVDIGSEIRQVVAGIAEVYKPEELVGRKVVVVANLQPRKLRGVESNGMIVAASVAPEGRPVLCTFTEEVPPGSKLK